MNTCQNEPLLSGKHLSKSYSGQQILSDVSVDLYQGEIVSVLGVSGIGKTTLFNILSGTGASRSGRGLLVWKSGYGPARASELYATKRLIAPFSYGAGQCDRPTDSTGCRQKNSQKTGLCILCGFRSLWLRKVISGINFLEECGRGLLYCEAIYTQVRLCCWMSLSPH